MLDILKFIYYKDFDLSDGQIAQLVERRTENPCVGGSIPSLATNKKASLVEVFFVALKKQKLFINAQIYFFIDKKTLSTYI